MKSIVVIATFMFFPVQSFACLFDTARNEFVLMQTIPVCFLESPQEGADPLSRARLNAKNAVIRSLRDLDEQTEVNFSGFEKCEAHDGNPQIRILLTSEGDAGRAMMGPEHVRAEMNLRMNFLIRAAHATNKSGAKGKLNSPLSNQPPQPQPLEFFNITAKHEVLHLLGFQHDERIGNTSVEKTLRINPTYRYLPDPANPQIPRPIHYGSIMTTSLTNTQSAAPVLRPWSQKLNDLEISCINGGLRESRRINSAPATAVPGESVDRVQ